jgi:hypothetical protein
MSFRETHRVYGIRCDKGGCDEQLIGGGLHLFEGHSHYERLALAEGWSIWDGRVRRAYCPQHGPTHGHQMKQVTAP